MSIERCPHGTYTMLTCYPCWFGNNPGGSDKTPYVMGLEMRVADLEKQGELLKMRLNDEHISATLMKEGAVELRKLSISRDDWENAARRGNQQRDELARKLAIAVTALAKIRDAPLGEHGDGIADDAIEQIESLKG